MNLSMEKEAYYNANNKYIDKAARFLLFAFRNAEYFR